MKFPDRRALILGLLPFLALTVTVPLWDRARPVILGLPFNFFWLLVWIPITSALLVLASRFERDR